MWTIDEIYRQLKTVLDPELRINVVDLGLIYKVEVIKRENSPRIKILMTLTTPGCPLGTVIITMIRDSLAALPGINPERDVNVEIVFDPPWVQDMMSEEAKAELGF
jgi:metal-sulfur cluster biosynthetic enzyme